MSTTPPTPAPAGEQDVLKPAALGATSITFFVIAAAAPLSLIAGYGPLGFLIGGVGAPGAFLVAGIVLCFFAVAFLAVTPHMKQAGTFYAYITHGLGRLPGRGAAVLALLAYLAINIGGMGILAVMTQTLITTATGWQVPWSVIALVLLVMIWYVARRGIDVGARVLGVLLAGEVAVLAVIAAAVVVRGDVSVAVTAASLSPANVFTPGMAAASVAWFGAFLGIESTAIYRAEARSPERSIPRATFAALGFLAVFYALVAWAVVNALQNPELAAAVEQDPTSLLYLIADDYVGHWASDVTQVLLVTSSFASGLAYFNTISRYGYSLGRDGVLPPWAARVHPRYRSPQAGDVQAVVSIVVVALFALAGADPYLQLTVWMSTPGVLGILLLMILTSVACVRFLLRVPVPGRTRAVGVTCGALAALSLSGVYWFMAANIELMTGGAPVIDALSRYGPFVLLLAAVLVSAVVSSTSSRRRGHRSPTPSPDGDPERSAAPLP